MSKEIPERVAPQYTVKGFFVGLTIVGLIIGAFFLYFIKGLYLLPDKVCDGAVQRDIAIRTLPRARAAEEWAGQGGTGRNFSFGCRVSTSGDSIMTGQVDLRESSKAAWIDSYGSLAGDHVMRVSKDGVEALAQTDSDTESASVYIPCVPTSIKESDASQTYALVANASVIGKSRATGTELRQALTDFAYQLTKHTYKLAECKDPRRFPEKLPRYENAR
ncbi:hypothetical protein ACFVW1_13215 [Streptomyces olivochromogenes]|uniref:hypothetical protein n=1 Tax=Streptomyces olivochromogenes TaxID=1963 RepID=UPI0036DF60B6